MGRLIWMTIAIVLAAETASATEPVYFCNDHGGPIWLSYVTKEGNA